MDSKESIIEYIEEEIAIFQQTRAEIKKIWENDINDLTAD